jgi:dihydrofolate reductase
VIKAIFAVDRNGGLGQGGSLPWPHDREDMLWFKNATTNHIVVMGSNTWLDPVMPKPLPNRHCVVVSNQDVSLFPQAHDTIWGGALEKSLRVLELQNPDKHIWIIGGAKLINSTKHLFREIHLTIFDKAYDCDVLLDVDGLLSGFEERYKTWGKDKTFSVWNAKL